MKNLNYHTINISNMCKEELLILKNRAEAHTTWFTEQINIEAQSVINLIDRLLEKKEKPTFSEKTNKVIEEIVDRINKQWEFNF
jgi:hypothetical protein